MDHTSRTQWKRIQKPFLTAITATFVLLQLLFLGNFCYLYGTQFRASSRVHNLHVLLVDYDGGVVGESLTAAYHAIKGHEFFTLDQRATADYATTEDVREAVCKGHYWAAIYSNTDASTRLSTALSSEAAAVNYQSNNALTYIWNEARYSAESEAEILANMQQLISVTRSMYYKINGTATAQFADMTSPTILQVFVDPIEATAINIQPTEQGSRVLYNTVTMVLPIIQQFFFLMALNGVSAQFRLYAHLGALWNGLFRATLSAAYTLLGSLCTAGYIWAYKEDWAVNGTQFVLTWMVFWLYMHVHFLVLDIATAYIPMHFLPFFVLTWVIMNVSSSITPFEMNPGFYRWGYALPAHETYQLLVEIWSGGCERQSYRALPILFAWWIAGTTMVIFATYHRCAVAVNAEAMERTLTSEAVPTEADDRGASATKGPGQEEDGYTSRPSTGSSAPPAIRRAWTHSEGQTPAYELNRLERKAYGPSYPPLFADRYSQNYQSL